MNKIGDKYRLTIYTEMDGGMDTGEIELSPDEARGVEKILRELKPDVGSLNYIHINFSNSTDLERIAEKHAKDEKERIEEEKRRRREEAKKAHEKDVRENGAFAVAFRKAFANGLTIEEKN